MKKTSFIIPLMLTALFVVGCGGKKLDSGDKKSSGNYENETSSASDDAIMTTESYEESPSSMQSKSKSEGLKDESGGESESFQMMASSTAARIGKVDSTRRLIRTVDMKFLSDDVVSTSYRIEDIIRKMDGFIEFTTIESEISRTQTTRISSDSLLESTYYHFVNDMTLRVPVANLDTTLKLIAPMIDFLDYRTIKAEDISFTLLRKELERKRLDLYNIQVSSLSTSGSSSDRLRAIEQQLQKQIENDEARIEMLELDDKVKFATISLHIYGRDKVRHVMLKDEEKIASYKPGFGSMIIQAIEKGWSVLKYLVFALVALWPLYLIGVLAWGTVVYIKRRNLKKKIKE